MPRGIVVGLIGLVGSGCLKAEEAPSASPARKSVEPWFVDRAKALGVEFMNDGGATVELYMPEVMGAGVALFDADGDDDLDLFFVNGNRNLPGKRGSGEIVDRFYENRLGQGGGFVDVTRESGLGDPDYGMGAAVGDFDNDGDRDLLTTSIDGVRLHENDGRGRFQDATARLGIAVPGWSSSAAFFDYDRDGFLDLYICRYVAFEPGLRCKNDAGKPDYCGPLAYPPVSDVVLHNDGGRGFSDRSGPARIDTARAAGLGVVCADFDGDGWSDVFVANDAYANQLWINQRDGTFKDMAIPMGVAFNLDGHTEAGMGVVAADFDGEGSLDLCVTHLVNEANILFLNLGAGRGFKDATGRSGLGPPSRPMTGFGVVAFDAELDGDLDLLVVNGRVNVGGVRRDSIPPAPWNQLSEPKLFHLNDGTARFALAGHAFGDIGSALEVSRGLAMGDIDDDGAVDVVVNNTASPARIYLNAAPRVGHWLRVRAVDPRLKRDALGAFVTLTAAGRKFVRCVESSSSYLSSSDARVHFGLGPAEIADALEVLWPDGLRETFACPGVDRTVELRRGEGQPAK